MVKLERVAWAILLNDGMNFKKISNYIYSLSYFVAISFMTWFLNLWLNVVTVNSNKEVNIFWYLWAIPFSFVLYLAHRQVYIIRESKRFQDAKISPQLNLIQATMTLVLIVMVVFYLSIDIHSDIIKSSSIFEKKFNTYYLTGLELFFSFLLLLLNKKRKKIKI